MIRLTDAVILAHTKLRIHKVRTGLTIGVAGILFGLILGVILVVQGVFDSVTSFSEEGLANRSIVSISKSNMHYYNPFDHAEDADFIAEVKTAHAEYVAKKTTAAKKYNIPYDAKTEDPVPVETDTTTKQERVDDGNNFQTPMIQEIIIRRTQEMHAALDINQYLAPYSSAKLLRGNAQIMGAGDGMPLTLMEDGLEESMLPVSERKRQPQSSITVQVLNSSLTEPFVVQDSFDYTKNEIPGVVSFSHAEKLLGLKKLPKTSTNQEKLQRITEVRNRVSEVSASFCYRNQASQQLLATAMQQRDEIELNKDNRAYIKPNVIYQLPDNDSCGAVTVASDTRTTLEKQQAENYQNYQKEIDEYPGDPWQHKMTLRAVGLSGDVADSVMTGTAGDMIMSLLGSWLSYGDNWSIPVGMLERTPEDIRPSQLFPDMDADGISGKIGNFMNYNAYMVEFSDTQEARDILSRGGAFDGQSEDENIYSYPFGSGTLLVDEVKRWFSTALLWALAVVGGVAFIILASLIGRMVSDGRRESAIFRAIGARRIDIGRIYSIYAFMLAVRVVVFAAASALVLAIVTDIWLSADATTAARLAYAAVDTTKEVHFIGFLTWYIPAILAAIIVVSLLASIIPILLGSRRSPIKDMRNDT